MIPLTSAYAHVSGCEPDFTNLTSTFHDTLDYIFFASPFINTAPNTSDDFPSSSTTSSVVDPSSLRVVDVRPVTHASHLDLVALERNTCGAKPTINPKKNKKPTPTQCEADGGSLEDEPNGITILSSSSSSIPSSNYPLSLVLPNLGWPSDHLLLEAEFVWKHSLRPNASPMPRIE